MKKKVLAVILTVAILSSLLVTAAGAVSVGDFTDVSSDSWYYEGVDFVSSKGYMVGVSTTEFAPDYHMTRAMFVTVLARVAGAKVDDTKSSFADVPANEWYTGSVTWAAENGITTGIGSNNFGPNAFVTREDMATFMSRFVAWYSKTTGQTHRTNALVSSFTDAASIHDYAKEAVEQCRQWGLINGYPNGAYGPQDFSTRAQVATVISRLYWLVNSTGPVGDTHTITAMLNNGTVEFQGNYIETKSSHTFNDNATVKSIIEGLVDISLVSDPYSRLLNASFNPAPFTTTVGGNEVTVTASMKKGIVSVVVSAPISMIMGAQGTTLAVSTDDITPADKDSIIDFVNSLQKEGGVANVTIADLAILNKLANTEITEDAVKDAIANASEEVKNLIPDSSVEELVEQATAYQEVIADIRNDLVEELVSTDSSLSADDLKSATIPKDVVSAVKNSTEDLTKVSISEEKAAEYQANVNKNSTVTIEIDLGSYLDRAQKSDKTRAINAICKFIENNGGKLGNDTETLIKDYVNAVAELSFVKAVENSNSVQLQDKTTFETYATAVRDGAVKLYEDIQSNNSENTTFFKNVINSMKQKAEDMGATVTISDTQIDALASVLTAGKVSHDNAEALGEITVTVTTDQATYNKALDYIKNAANIPATIKNAAEKAPAFENLPEAIRNLSGRTYTLTITVE